MELLRPILELGVVIPGMLLAYFPAKSSLKQPLSTKKRVSSFGGAMNVLKGWRVASVF